MRRTFEVALSVVLVVWIGWSVFQGASYWLNQIPGMALPRGWGRQAGLFPAVIGAPVLVLAVIQLFNAFRSPRTAIVADELGEITTDEMARRSVGIIVTMVGFALAIWLLGFVIAIPASTFAFLRFVAKEPWRISVVMATAAGLSFYLFFVMAIGIRLPTGYLLEWLFE